jgi:4-carboxymuconolactone decarboxylase
VTDTFRIPPLPPADWGEEEHAAYAVLQSEATRDIGAASNVTMVLAQHPKLAKAYYTLGRHLLIESSVPHRLRELVTLRVAWHTKSGYEWHHHVRFGLRIGLTDDEIEAVKKGPEAAIWSASDRCVLRLTDELYEKSRISDLTWQELNQVLDRHRVMDLVFTIGHYVMTAWAIAAFGIPIEPGFEISDHPLK